MGFDFTIAIIPDNLSLDREMSYIKSALLYADQVTLISPLAYMFDRLTDKSNGINEKSAIRLFEQILPLAKLSDIEFYNSSYPVIKQFSKMINSKQYRALPYVDRISLQRQLREFAAQICETMLTLVDEKQGRELQLLIDRGQVRIEKFNNSLGDLDLCVQDYFSLLTKSIRSSYPLFDPQSNNLMKAALNSKVVSLSAVDRQKITHASMADNYIQRLPCFEEATMQELIDIKSELAQPLIRFRAKMLEYSDSIQSVPWDDNFENECDLLYAKEIAPALLEIEECTKDGSFVKNLGSKFFADEGFWKSTGGLAISIAAGGVISAFNSAISVDTAMLVTGGSYAATKIAAAYEEYIASRKMVERKDMYFYYKTGKLLSSR